MNTKAQGFCYVLLLYVTVNDKLPPEGGRVNQAFVPVLCWEGFFTGGAGACLRERLPFAAVFVCNNKKHGANVQRNHRELFAFL